MVHFFEVGCIGESSWHGFLSETNEYRLDIVEPIPRNLAEIRKVYKDDPNVFVHPYAVWKEPGTIKMYNLERLSYIEGVASPAIGTYDGMSAPGVPTRTLGYKPREEDLIEVETVTLDQLDDGSIDMLDLDMEGSEWYALEKLVSRPKILVVETGVVRTGHPFITEIDGWAEENGYTEFRHHDSNSWFKRPMMTDEEKEKIQNEGRTACVMLWSTGVMGSHDDCKYAEGSPEREVWMAGWNEVDEVNKNARSDANRDAPPRFDPPL